MALDWANAPDALIVTELPLRFGRRGSPRPEAAVGL
jgi:hypothetical protein